MSCVSSRVPQERAFLGEGGGGNVIDLSLSYSSSLAHMADFMDCAFRCWTYECRELGVR